MLTITNKEKLIDHGIINKASKTTWMVVGIDEEVEWDLKQNPPLAPKPFYRITLHNADKSEVEYALLYRDELLKHDQNGGVYKTGHYLLSSMNKDGFKNERYISKKVIQHRVNLLSNISDVIFENNPIGIQTTKARKIQLQKLVNLTNPIPNANYKK